MGCHIDQVFYLTELKLQNQKTLNLESEMCDLCLADRLLSLIAPDSKGRR